MSRYGDKDLATNYNEILEAIKVYRTKLLHLGLFAVIEGMIPRREWLAQYDDLRTVLDTLVSPNRVGIIRAHFVDPEDQCRSDLERLLAVLDRIWAVVVQEFEGIADSGQYQEQRSRVSSADRATCSIWWTPGIVSYASTSGSSVVTPSGVATFPPEIELSPGDQ